MPKSKPIIFDIYSVQAILNGQKTQTRRVIKAQPEPVAEGFMLPLRPQCPYGYIGDTLWIRETFTYWENQKGEDFLRYKDGVLRSLGEWKYPHPIYDHCVGKFNKWISPIFMPQWASRIALVITGVKVERLHDISKSDAIAEGIKQFDYGLDSYALAQGKEVRTYLYGTRELAPSCMETSAREAFRRRWDSINRKKHPWDSNPWVWIVEFNQAPAPQNPINGAGKPQRNRPAILPTTERRGGSVHRRRGRASSLKTSLETDKFQSNTFRLALNKP